MINEKITVMITTFSSINRRVLARQGLHHDPKHEKKTSPHCPQHEGAATKWLGLTGLSTKLRTALKYI